MLFDSHSHPHFAAYREDSDEVIRRALDNGIQMLLVGTHAATSKATVECAERYDGVWAAIGLHPVHVTDGYFDPNEDAHPTSEKIDGGFRRRAEVFDAEFYRALAQSSKKVVAIGETGLDYYRLEGSDAEKEDIKALQRKTFVAQAELAGELGLTIVVHCREAHDDAFEILKQAKQKYPYLRVIIHCFTGKPEEAERHLTLGAFISFPGIITFARDWDDFIKRAPLDRLLVETDCPYLTPVPFRGKRNEPAYVEYTARKMAEIRNQPFEEVAKATFENTRRALNIG